MKRILELGCSDCRWPIHTDHSGLHFFCGKRCEPGCSYCATHYEMSVEPEPPDWWLELDELFGVKH